MNDAYTQDLGADAEVDARDLNCPMPLLKAKLALNQLASGAVLKVIATDAGSQRDFRAFARLAGHSLMHEEEEAGVFRYWLRKA
ncbi:MAG: sulfurtransferase TusA family protein [Pseudomonas sp.]|uniref:sulfurtransferase TusA family protein n=1 Tax=Pseudomonas sp. TaxID=306 RepID=UPI00391DDDBB